MCGICGIYSFTEKGKSGFGKIEDAVQSLHQRGPDGQGVYRDVNVVMGHTRLSILDISEAASQPFYDPTGRYSLVYNGELYNYKALRKKLINSGVSFSSESDTEVLLQGLIQYGIPFIEQVNGFFAFAFYDAHENRLLIARDRIGIKPLYYFNDAHSLIWASEMKAILRLGAPREIDHTSLYQYLQLNYIPEPHSIFKGVSKLLPGSFMEITSNGINQDTYYSIPPVEATASATSYDDAKQKLGSLLEQAVTARLVSDVPLGCFLSGGIDSSIIVGLARKHVDSLNTYSIGFKDHPYFDETGYAALVAGQHQTNHTVFSLSNNDLYANLFDILNYVDEPFADSSALAVYALCRETRRHVTVALSGDGADELFGGYNKYRATLMARQDSMKNRLIAAGGPLWKSLPKSRNSSLSNTLRQLDRYADGLSLSEKERYWRWCGFANETEAGALVKRFDIREYNSRKGVITAAIGGRDGINDVLRSDMQMVLVNDMLVKVDRMSMANSLEVRVPFLDHRVVDFMFTLRSDFKINNDTRKKLLRDTFGYLLPPEILTRQKHGFEVPLLHWFRTGLKDLIVNDLLSETLIEEQGIFNYAEIATMKNKLFSSNPGDIHARLWGLIVFQYWWKQTIARNA